VIKLDRPPVNALCTEMLDELEDSLEDLSDARCVVITGEGKAFVAGADISEMKDMTPEEAHEFSRKGHGVFGKIRELPIPVISAVNGYALGGGLELAMTADMIVASDRAQFGQPEVGLGIIPGFGGTQMLSRLVGPSHAKELIFTGKTIDAQRALEIGLVNKVVPGEELMDTVMNIAKTISSNGPAAVSLAKSSIDDGLELVMDEALELEASNFERCFSTEDQKEGMEAFLSKRKPEFKGE